MNRKFFVLIATLLSFSAFCQEITIYKWVDEKGVVHFDQHQPLTKDYVELKVESKYAPVTAPLVQDKTPVESEQNSEMVPAEATQDIAKCNIAKANLRTLTDYSKIQVTDSDGNSRMLTDVEKMQRLKKAEEEIKLYCQ